MKTFKLVALQVESQGSLEEIELIDGLIINKEDENKSWLIEAFVEQKYLSFFNRLFSQNEKLSIQTIITKRENDPAPFEVRICSVKKMTNHMNVVMEGKLSRSRQEYTELLLQELINEGLSGENLLMAFKQKLHTKPRVPFTKKE